MKITAVIPVRKGSQRVPEKSFRPFANSNLLKLKIEKLKQAACFDDIVVNTDSEKAIKIAKKSGVNYHRREPFYASSQCSASDFFHHIGNSTQTDVFAYTPVTVPFIKSKTYQKCVENFKTDNGHDSFATVTLMKHHMWLNGEPLNYELDKQPNSQNLPNIYAINWGLCLIHKEDLLQYKNVIGKNPEFVQLSSIEGIDIDTPLDFFIAEQVYIRTVIEKNKLVKF
ncbi:MAG TPA: hypothetical protein VJ970_01950 [Flavobacteriaceae bacterium]|nr:hypothetical protein [Flavobacteriaceae bacterium]